MNHFLGIAQRVHFVIALVEQIVQVAENGAEILAGGDRAPSADGMETHGHCAFGEQRGHFVGDDGVGVIDAENYKVRALRDALAILALAAGSRIFKCADDVFGAEVARAETVAAADKPRNFGELDFGQAIRSLHCFREGRADVAAEWIVAGQRFVGTLQYDDVLLAFEGVHKRGFGEGANHVHVNRSHAGVARLAQIIDSGFDVFGRRAERNKDRFGVRGLVLADEPVSPAGKLGKLLERGFKKMQNRLREVVAPRHHALHVVFLILHRAEQDGIGEIHHLGHAAARGSE